MDARVAKTHAAVMRAATELLLDGGPDALTVDAVVARSGVAKSTVYRHWATRDELVADVFTQCAPRIVEPDRTLAFEPALRELVASMVALLTDEYWRALLPAMLLLKSRKDEIAELDSELKVEQTRVFSDVLQRGIDEGVLRPNVLDELEITVALLIGPLVMAGLVDSVPLNDTFVDAVVHQFLAAHRVMSSA